ncbi:MAG TPA: zinc-binding dehydrogenase, partial [Acidimicrobiales bacterium]|nr:zinc-binding dehydrogenase [Acidimicrobiales bacterium]
AAARREGPLRQLLDHGADEIAVMTGEDDEAVLRKAAEGPYDVVVDYVFGRAFEAALPTTNSGDPEDEGQGGSRYVVVGEFELGGSVRLPIAPLFGLTIRGHQNSAVPHEERRDVFEHLARLAMAGELWTEIEEVALEDVSTAWTRVGSSAHAKVIVRP